MRERTREKEETEVGLHLQSQWESTVIYTHLTALNAIKDRPVLFHGEDNDGVCLCPNIFDHAGSHLFFAITKAIQLLPFKK